MGWTGDLIHICKYLDEFILKLALVSIHLKSCTAICNLGEMLEPLVTI